jgi:hypothetical protein
LSIYHPAFLTIKYGAEMKRIQSQIITSIFLVALFLLSGISTSFAKDGESDKLLILFTSADKEVMTKMAGAYQIFAMQKELWKECRFLIWGPSAKMIAESEEAQEMIKKMKDAGIETLACKWCAEQYGVQDKIAELGAEVKYMGKDLTDMIKGDWNVLTF